MKHSTFWLASLAVVLSACRANTLPNDTASSSSARPSSSSSVEAVSVVFEGVVRDGDASIYMQGTHRLELDDGRTVLLESPELSLSRYVGRRVSVLGLSQPSVEGDTLLVRVREITVLTDDASSSSEEQSSDAFSSEAVSSSPAPASSAQASSIASSLPRSSSRSSAPRSSSSSLAAPVSSSAAAQSSSVVGAVPSENTDANQEAAIAMSKVSMTEANWSQKYCTTHIGFCFPVHKNWWFKSFGTTSSHLWHVEISNVEIEELGQGPLVVNLSSGSAEAEGAADGEVRTQGDFVVGYKNWTEGRHIQVSAPAVLQPAVRYILGNISATPVQ